jgi:hypothetical protein
MRKTIRVSLVVLLAVATALGVAALTPLRADAELYGAPALDVDDLIALNVALAEGEAKSMVVVGRSDVLAVPAGKAFVLTDLVVSPQVFPPEGEYAIQVVSRPGPLTTAISFNASAANPASFQVHLQTGMVFRAGSTVWVGLTFGDMPVSVSAFGRLVDAR